jgi:hypothetical protein
LPLYVDGNNELWEFDPKDAGELDQLAREGFTPAGETDVERHNTAVDVQQAEETSSFGSAALGGAERTFSRGLSGVLNAAAPIVKAMNPGMDLSGMPDITPEMVAPRRENQTAQSPEGDPVAFSEHERLVGKARPFANMLGQSAVATPFAMAAGALAAPELAAGAGLLARGGAALLSAGTEAAAEAVPQEYEDAWLEKRAPTLKGVAMNTLFFAGGDLALRGTIGVAGHLLGRRSALAEASGKAARADSKVGKSGLREARSVGAAAATKDEATQAIESLSDHDAVILDRDAADYTKLAAVSATDAMNRVQEGFENELSYASKTSDWQAGADLWTTKNTKAQNSEWEALTVKRQALDEEIRSGGRYGYDFGAQGAKLREVNDHYAELWEKAEGAERNTVMDSYKRALDKHIMRVAGARNLDEGVKNKLVDLMQPYADDLRKGLTNRKIWGRNADLQRDTNKGWEQLLGHWKVIQKKLYEETGVVHFADTSGTRRQMQATTERMYSAMTKNPVLQREFLEHYEGALDGIEMMTEARRAWTLGPVQKLDELHDSLRTLAKDWNFSSVVGAAQARVEHLKKSPGTFTALAAQAALQRAPFGLGPVVSALGKYLEHTRIKKGTPLASLVEDNLRRYGKHPILSDARVAADFAPWMRDALREAGAPIAPTPAPPKGAGAAAAASKAAVDEGPGIGEQAADFVKEHGSKVAGAGLFGLAASQKDDDSQGMAASAGLLAFFAPKLGSRLSRKELAKASEEAMRSLRPAERADVHAAIQATQDDTELWLLRGVSGEGGEGFGPGELLDRQRGEVVSALQRTAGEWPAGRDRLLYDAIEAELQHRNLIAIENDPALRGKVQAGAPEERTRVDRLGQLAPEAHGFATLHEMGTREHLLLAALPEGSRQELRRAMHDRADNIYGAFLNYARGEPQRRTNHILKTQEQLVQEQLVSVGYAYNQAFGRPANRGLPYEVEQATRAQLQGINAVYRHADEAAPFVQSTVTPERRASLARSIDQVLGHMKLAGTTPDAAQAMRLLNSRGGQFHNPVRTSTGARDADRFFNDERAVVGELLAERLVPRPPGLDDHRARSIMSDVRSQLGAYRPSEHGGIDTEKLIDATTHNHDLTTDERDWLRGQMRYIEPAAERAGMRAEKQESRAARTEMHEEGSSDPAELGLPPDVRRLGGGINVQVHDEGAVDRIFGGPLSKRDLHDMLGLDELETLRGTLALKRDSVTFTGETSDGVELQRIYERRGSDLTIYHAYFRVPEGMQGKGMGKATIRGMFDFYERRGAKSVGVSAIEIGRYFWPWLGFQPSEDALQQALHAIRSGLKYEPSVHPGDFGLKLAPEQIDELMANVKSMRDIADLTIPMSAVPEAKRETVRKWSQYERHFKEGAPKDGPPKDETIKIGKKFLLSESGSWNRDMKVDVAPGTPWYDKFKLRLAGLLGLGFSLEEVMRAMGGGVTGHMGDESARRDTGPSLSLFDAPGRPVQSEPVTASLAHARALKDIDMAASTVLTSRARQLLGTQKPPPSRGILATMARRGQSPGKALEEVRDKLTALDGDPGQLMANIAENLGDLPRTHPTVYTAIAQQLAQVTGYLRREIPRPKGRSLLEPKGTPPDTGEVLEFAAKYAGATDPDGALRDMARGEALPQQVQAFRDNWGDKYQQFRLRVLGELSAMGEKSKTLPFERMARLDEYLELDGASNRALSWAVADAFEQARLESPEPQAKAPGGGPSTSTQFQTRAAAAATERGMA